MYQKNRLVTTTCEMQGPGFYRAAAAHDTTAPILHGGLQPAQKSGRAG